MTNGTVDESVVKQTQEVSNVKEVIETRVGYKIIAKNEKN